MIARGLLTREIWRYGLVSIAALALDAGLLLFFVEVAGWHYLVAGAAGFLSGLGLAYTLSVAWVFSHRSRASPREEVAIFGLIGIAGLGLNELVLWVGTGVLGFHYMLSKAAAAGASFTFNFGFRKWLLFHPRKNPGPGFGSRSSARGRRG